MAQTKNFDICVHLVNMVVLQSNVNIQIAIKDKICFIA